MVIVTKSDEQIFVELNDFHGMPIEQRGPKLTITVDGYVPYPMHTLIRWMHKDEERGMYKIYKSIWENGKTKIYIKEE
ncbi:MAG: hypothetical protein K0R18_180 [Bacillales bacterium]|jgi:hypothetical protein|nr:hypothetical protein [Bacillales bacterium]